MLSEHQEQCLFVEWFEKQFPTVRIMAIPNGIRTSIGAAVKAKKEGVRSGVPDTFIPAWKMWIEFKKEKGGTVSAAQKDWIAYLQGLGYTVYVARGFDNGKQQVIDYLDSL